MAKDMMKAVVFLGPHKVAVEDRPIPKIKEPEDVIVKVVYSALCGSELHVFRVRCLPKKVRIYHHSQACRVINQARLALSW